MVINKKAQGPIPAPPTAELILPPTIATFGTEADAQGMESASSGNHGDRCIGSNND